MKAVVIISILVNLLSNENVQVTDYSKFVKEELINKKQTVKTYDGKEDIVYLGKIVNTNGQVLFYVLTIYSEVQSTFVIHGHSNVLYLDRGKLVKRQFDLGEPENLPFKLKNNTLYFHHLDAKTKKEKLYTTHVGTEIPKLLCVKPDDCY